MVDGTWLRHPSNKTRKFMSTTHKEQLMLQGLFQIVRHIDNLKSACATRIDQSICNIQATSYTSWCAQLSKKITQFIIISLLLNFG